MSPACSRSWDWGRSWPGSGCPWLPRRPRPPGGASGCWRRPGAGSRPTYTAFLLALAVPSARPAAVGARDKGAGFPGPPRPCPWRCGSPAPPSPAASAGHATRTFLAWPAGRSGRAVAGPRTRSEQAHPSRVCAAVPGLAAAPATPRSARRWALQAPVPCVGPMESSTRCSPRSESGPAAWRFPVRAWERCRTGVRPAREPFRWSARAPPRCSRLPGSGRRAGVLVATRYPPPK